MKSKFFELVGQRLADEAFPDELFHAPGIYKIQLFLLETASASSFAITPSKSESRTLVRRRQHASKTFDCSTTRSGIIRSNCVGPASLGFALRKRDALNAGEYSWRRPASNKCSASCYIKASNGE